MSHLRYSYDEISDQITLEDGRTIPRPAQIPREHFLATRHSSSSRHNFNHQTFVQNRYDASARMNAPRTLPYNVPTYSQVQNVAQAPNTYALAPGVPQQASPQLQRRSLPNGQEYWQPYQGPGAVPLPGNQPFRPPTDVTALVNSMSISGSRQQDAYHPPVTRTPQSPQTNATQVYVAPGSMPRSWPQNPGWTPEADQKALYASFKRKEKSKKFFVTGKVFLTLWNEPAGEQASNATAITSSISVGPFGERIHSKIRRFVVVREGEVSCTALPILTYGRQGVGKARVKKSEHAVIYTGREPPEPLYSERNKRGEDGLLKPIRVDPDDIAEKLDNLSRVDFGKVYCIEHNVKVRSFGKVNNAFMATLSYQFRKVWGDTLKEPGSQMSVQTPSGVRVEKIEATTSARPADLMNAYYTLLAAGYTTDKIKSVLRSGFQPPHAGGPSDSVNQHMANGSEDRDDDDDDDDDDDEKDSQRYDDDD